jgi:hypothetical protein
VDRGGRKGKNMFGECGKTHDGVPEDQGTAREALRALGPGCRTEDEVPWPGFWKAHCHQWAWNMSTEGKFPSCPICLRPASWTFLRSMHGPQV